MFDVRVLQYTPLKESYQAYKVSHIDNLSWKELSS